MNKLFNKNNIITIGFYGGLAIKAINAVVEFIAGFLMIILSHDLINRLIWFTALPELREDPNDIVMNYLIKLSQNLSISSQHLAAIYMLLHGTAKLLIIWPLLKKKIWAYPISAAVLGLFITYEIYNYLYSRSVILLLIIILDISIVCMIILEYKRLKAEKSEKEV